MKKNIEVVLLGDSIIKRGDWINLLDNNQLINLGSDGDTTKGILNRMDIIFEIEPKSLILMIGVNDLCISTPLDEVFENYKMILNRLKRSPIFVVVNAIFLTQMASVNKKIVKFNALLETYCKKDGFTFLNLNDSFENEKGLLKEELTTDGLHLGEKAYKVWAYKLKQVLAN